MPTEISCVVELDHDHARVEEASPWFCLPVIAIREDGITAVEFRECSSRPHQFVSKGGTVRRIGSTSSNSFQPACAGRNGVELSAQRPGESVALRVDVKCRAVTCRQTSRSRRVSPSSIEGPLYERGRGAQHSRKSRATEVIPAVDTKSPRAVAGPASSSLAMCESRRLETRSRPV